MMLTVKNHPVIMETNTNLVTNNKIILLECVFKINLYVRKINPTPTSDPKSDSICHLFSHILRHVLIYNI